MNKGIDSLRSLEFYFIGIGGISMSGLAAWRRHGFGAGSDMHIAREQRTESKGIKSTVSGCIEYSGF